MRAHSRNFTMPYAYSTDTAIFSPKIEILHPFYRTDIVILMQQIPEPTTDSDY